jgi:hypothetical protein
MPLQIIELLAQAKPMTTQGEGGFLGSSCVSVGLILFIAYVLLVAVSRVLSGQGYDPAKTQGFATINPGTHELKIYHEPNSDRPVYTMKLQKRPANVQTAGGIVYVSYDRGPTEKYNLHDARFIGSV